MPEEYFDVAYINFSKAILCGRIVGGLDENRCRIECDVEQILTSEQAEKISDLNSAHQQKLNKLLASFVDRKAAFAANGIDPQ